MSLSEELSCDNIFGVSGDGMSVDVVPKVVFFFPDIFLYCTCKKKTNTATSENKCLMIKLSSCFPYN